MLGRLAADLGAREPFLVLTGEPGIGKSTLVHEGLARWEAHVTSAVLTYPPADGDELLEEVVRRFGAEPPEGASRSKLVACLEGALAAIADTGCIPMLVVDDAHALSPGALEGLRLLVSAAEQSRHRLEVLLVGLPALDILLDDASQAALRQRISVRATLGPMSEGETRRYLRHRASAAGGDGANLFPRKTCTAIAERSGGVPRQVNALAAAAMRAAQAQGAHAVAPEHVDKAAGTSSAAGAASVAASGQRAQAGAAAAPPGRGPRTTADDAASTSPSDAAPGAPSPGVSGTRWQRPEFDPPPVVPKTHDAAEWVARFVGDRGPVRIGAQVMAAAMSADDLVEPLASGAAGGTDAAEDRPRRAPARGPARPRAGSSRRPRRVPVALLAALVVVPALALVIRAGGLMHHRPASSTTVAAAARPRRRHPLPPAGAPAPPPASTAPADSVAAPASDTAGTAIVLPSPRRYTLDAGAFPDRESALAARDNIQNLTGMQAWVVAAGDDSIGPHHVVIGVFRTPDAASTAMAALVSSHTLDSLTVVPLPPRSARR